MKGLFYRVSLRVKLAAVIVLAVLLSALLVGYYSFYSARSVVRLDQRKALGEITNLITMGIDGRIGALNRQLKQAADSQQVRRYIQQLPADADPDLIEYFDASLAAFGHVNALYVVFDSGLYLPGQNGGQPLDTETLSSLWGAAESAPATVIWQGIRKPLAYDTDLEPKEPFPVIGALRAINDEDGQMIAVLVLELKSREFDNVLLSNRASLSYQYRMIFDKDMQLLAANRTLDPATTASMLGRFQGGDKSFQLDTGNTSYYVQGQYDGLTGWTVFCAQEVVSAFPQSDELVRIILKFVLSTSFIISAAVVLFSRSITRPITSLSHAMYRFEKGDFSARLTPNSQDEMGRLMHSFNFMADEIDRLIRQVFEVELAQKEAELAALQAQINPHFLYNTLDNLQWMLVERGEEDIARSVVALGKILRYCVSRNQRLVPFHYEIQYAEHYLYIQKQRLENRLVYTISVDESLRDYLVPRLILQPLIENAILHGIEDRPGARIEIHAHTREDRLIILLEDDGTGMSPERLKEVRAMMTSDESSAHLGLQNVHRRLQLIYGAGYGLTVNAGRKTGCRVELSMPLWLTDPEEGGNGEAGDST